MFRKMLCIVLMMGLIMTGWGMGILNVYAGNDPEPQWLIPTDDAWLYQSYPDSNHDGVGEYLQAFGRTQWNSAKVAYMKFNISSIEASELNTAKIRIYAKNSRCSVDTLNVYGVDDTDWTETGITWNNASVTDFSSYTPLASFPLDSTESFAYYYIDIKDYIIQQDNNGETNITLAFAAPSPYYTVSIHSKEDDGFNTNPPYLIVNEDNTPPSIPQNLQGEAISTEEVELTWDASTDNVTVAEYEIYMDDEKAETVAADVYAETCSYIIGSLQPSTWYSFYVKAADTSQNVSEASETVTVQTQHLPDNEPPSIPLNLSAKILSPSKVRLTWDPSTDNIAIDGYTVFCDGDEIATVGEDGYLGYEVEGLSAGTGYAFSVVAFDLAGNSSGISEEITVTTLSEPDTESPEAPENLQISELSVYSSEATLTWDVSPDNIETAGYIIYVNGGEKARVAVTSCQLTDLAPNTEYSVCVKAYDEAGNVSEASDVLIATTSYTAMKTVGTDGDYATIQAAADAMDPGDVILIKDGTYVEELNITRSGTAGKWITIMAEGNNALINGKMTLNASYIRLAGLKMDGYVDDAYYGQAIIIKKPYTQIVGMNVTRYHADAIYFELNSGNAYVADNYILDCGGGFYTSSDSIFERNEIDTLDMNGRTAGDCNYFTVFGENVVIRNNYTHGTVFGSHLAQSHVDFLQTFDNNRHPSKNILVENNFFSGFTHQGVMLSNHMFATTENVFYASDWTIRNNVFKDFISWGICGGYGDDGGIPNLIVENNTFIGDPSANDSAGAWYGPMLTGYGGSGVIRNNIIMNVAAASYGALDNAVLTDCGNNLIYNAPDPHLSATDIVGVDPKFVDPAAGNFNLSADSYGIDNGAEVDFNYDLEGKVRPYGDGFDIGAYEFHGVKANTPPFISITSPEAGQQYDVGDSVGITVDTSDDNGVVKVEYYLNDNKVGESTQYPFDYSITDIQEGIQRLYAIAYDEEGLFTESDELIFFASDTPYIIGEFAYGNEPIGSQQGTITAIFDIMLLSETMNSYVGLTAGQAGALGDMATIVRFKDGVIDAINGSSYSAENVIPYSTGEIYTVTMTVDIPQRLYSVTVTDGENNTQVVCSDFSFRDSKPTPDNILDTLVTYSHEGTFVITEYFVGEFVQPESLNIIEDNITMNVGDTHTLTADVLPQNATISGIEWQSFNLAAATVDENGIVTGIAEGSAVIMATVAGTSISDVCTVLVNPAQEETAITIESPATVVTGQEFTVDIGFESTDMDMEVQCAEITVSYDTSLFEYKRCEEINGGLSKIEDRNTPGEGSIVIAGEGEGTAISEDVTLIKVVFEAKDATGTGEINITEAEFAVPVPGGEDPPLVLPTLSGITVEVTEELIPGDLNEDGVVNVLDLYYVSIHYGKTSESDDWGTAQIADVNNDDVVDIQDLVYVARRILGLE